MVDLLNKRQPALTIQQIKLHRGTRETQFAEDWAVRREQIVVAIMICNRLG